MSMNPFTLLEKAINEHGSSTILKERLKLAADQYEDLTRKNSDLIAQNKSLQKQLQESQSEIQKLNNLIKTMSGNQEARALNEVTSRILEYFFDAQHNPSIEEVAGHMGFELNMVSYHFDVLKENKYIQQATVASSGPTLVIDVDGSSSNKPATYRITPNGRKYVVEEIRS